MKNILIRADGFKERGLGHVYRVATLGRILASEPGVEFSYLCMEHEFTMRTLESVGADVYTMPMMRDRSEMFRGTVEVCKRLRPGVLCLDVLETPLEIMRELKKTCGAIVTIDDPGPGGVVADAIVGVDIGVMKETLPRGVVEDGGGRLYGGPRYAIINEEVAALRDGAASAAAGNKFDNNRVLVTFGGSDPQNVTARVLEDLRALPDDVRVTAVLGPCNEHAETIRRVRRDFGDRLDVVIAPPNLPELMHESTVAVCGVGVTLYELLTLGTPSVVVSQARPQEHFAEQFDSYGCAPHVGRCDLYKCADLLERVEELLTSRDAWTERRHVARDTFDGRGARRTCDVLMEIASETEQA